MLGTAVQVRAGYVDTMNKMCKSKMIQYQSSLARVQMDVVSRSDLIGAEEGSVSGLFNRARDAIRHRHSVFALDGCATHTSACAFD